MKILSLTKVSHSSSGLKLRDVHILNPHSVIEISGETLFDPKQNSWVDVTRILFKDGHTVTVKEDSTLVKDTWRDSL